VYLNPVGAMELKGFATVLAFFKGTLEKLEVQPEIFYAGKFKSATEPFRADKISDPNRLQIQAFQSDFWTEFISAVSEHTKTDTTAINQLAATGAIQLPQDALNNKLVDGLLYWDQVEDLIKKKTGIKDKEDINYLQLNEYVQSQKGGVKGDTRIAVLFAEGSINDGETDESYEIASKNMTEAIRKLRDNEKIKAVVLRVNSPGGSALASEVILRELQLLKAKKPLVVSMGDYAASGGYYIACQADSVFALPNTITGSIGVFSVLFNGESLMKNKLGVTFDQVKNAPYADFPAVYRPLTVDEATRMQRGVDNTYSIFKGRVAKGRKLDEAIVDSIAQGRVWTGTDALQIGLVDALGDLDRAIESASRLAKLKTYDVVTYPEPTDKFETMLKKFKGNAGATSMMAAIEKEMGSDYEIYKKIKALRDINGKTMMLMPFTMSVQ
jgi:protease-4